jgi:protein SCO1/2
MAENMYKGSKKQWALFAALLPLLLFGLFHLYTKRARADVSTMVYPEKMFPIGLDTIEGGGGYKSIDSVYYVVPDFSFTNQYSQNISKFDLNDKVMLFNFFFTSCPSICPKMTEQMARVQKTFIRDDQVVLVSVSIDPARDTVQQLKEYAAEYAAIPGKWHFLTGDKDAIYDFAGLGLKLLAQSEGGDASHDGFVHSDRVVLVDPDWNIRGFYNGTDFKDVNFMMGDVTLILKEFTR